MTVEEVESDAEEQRAMVEALRLLAKWLCQVGLEDAARERRAA